MARPTCRRRNIHPPNMSERRWFVRALATVVVVWIAVCLAGQTAATSQAPVTGGGCELPPTTTTGPPDPSTSSGSSRAQSRDDTVRPVSSTSDPAATLQQYCVTCHNERLKTAGLVIDPSTLPDVSTGAEQWEK